ncbi:MAG: hypothetical protein WAV41_06155, partial [Microgenomates group bacterium]
FFLLLLLHYQLFFLAFILVIVPLLYFRVLIGFHYPIDIIGGIVIGAVIYFLVTYIQMPPVINQYIQNIFSVIFYYPIKLGI